MSKTHQLMFITIILFSFSCSSPRKGYRDINFSNVSKKLIANNWKHGLAWVPGQQWHCGENWTPQTLQLKNKDWYNSRQWPRDLEMSKKDAKTTFLLEAIQGKYWVIMEESSGTYCAGTVLLGTLLTILPQWGKEKKSYYCKTSQTNAANKRVNKCQK